MTVVRKIHIENYRVFQKFSLDFDPGVNILVGDNDVGKSTLLEAVNLALTARLGDRYLGYALSPYLFNEAATVEYTDAIAAKQPATPPEFFIELFLEDDGTPELAALSGRNNVDSEDCAGLRIRAAFDSAYSEEHKAFVEEEKSQVTLVPTEYYKVEWLSFAGNGVTRRVIPLKPSRIDASEIRLQSGADYHLQEIITEQLEPSERVELARAYRSLRETFADNDAVKSINENLAASPSNLAEGELRLSIDVSQKTAWEASLVPHLENLPFQFIGNGSRSMLKVLLALHRSRDASQVVLIEEPENHLSPANLNRFVDRISDCCKDRQVLIATHSSYVLNKLGLDRLLLVGPQTKMRLRDLPDDTLDYFRKLSGYDTLRLVLAEKAILVEGPSDELIVQRAYRDAHQKLPMEDGVDVISVAGLSFKRFLDIAVPLGKRVTVVTDLDKSEPQEIQEKYEPYTKDSPISVYTGTNPSDGTTLESQVVTVNDLAALNTILGTEHQDKKALTEWMTARKTEWALRVFETDQPVTMPDYIRDAVVAN